MSSDVLVAADRGADGADGAAPRCFIVDQEDAARKLIASTLTDVGIAVEQFRDVREMLAAFTVARAQVIFVDLGASGNAAVEAIQTFADMGIDCPIQLMSGLNAVLVEGIRKAGQDFGLTMLPAMAKPLRTNAIREVAKELGLRRDRLSSVHVSLSEAIANNWLEVWYQPKIDLKKRTLFGAEAYVRIRHPEHGVLPPETFLAGAKDDALIVLTVHVLKAALADSVQFAEAGIPAHLSINVPKASLTKIPFGNVFMAHQQRRLKENSFLLEITERDIIQDLALAQRVAAELSKYNAGLAVDNFGTEYAALARTTALPFTEIKIDRSYVANCNLEGVSRGICASVVELAHKFGIRAVAEGVETPKELEALQQMGCDLAQGYLFARPLPRNEFIALAQRRMKPRTTAPQAS
jgi:EAL domain-containing protein (putative c-di-GMP-specific phosphodiesterase class I)/ActR/RegA family two-component response regulator